MDIRRYDRYNVSQKIQNLQIPAAQGNLKAILPGKLQNKCRNARALFYPISIKHVMECQTGEYLLNQ